MDIDIFDRELRALKARVDALTTSKATATSGLEVEIKMSHEMQAALDQVVHELRGLDARVTALAARVDALPPAAPELADISDEASD